MAVFEFTMTGKFEVDGDSLGVAVSNSIRTQPNGEGEIVVDDFTFRMNPAEAMRMLVLMGFSQVVEAKITPLNCGWTILALDATASEVPQ